MVREKLVIDDFAQFRYLAWSTKWCNIYLERDTDGKGSWVRFVIKTHKNYDTVYQVDLLDDDIDKIIKFLQEVKAQKSTKPSKRKGT